MRKVSEVAATREDRTTVEAAVTSKGQITLPQRLRRDLDIRPGDRVVFTRLDDGHWVLGRTLGKVPDIVALIGFGSDPEERQTTDQIMEDVRGRRPSEPLP